MTVRQVVTLPRLRSALPAAACWVWTRAVLVMFTYKIVPYISQGDIVGDVRLYNQWSQIFAHGHFPHDPQWQYPPGAAFVIVLPRLMRAATGISYYSAFYLMALVSDLIIFLLVLYASWQTAERRAAVAGLAPGAAGPSGWAWAWGEGWAWGWGRGWAWGREGVRRAWRGKTRATTADGHAQAADGTAQAGGTSPQTGPGKKSRNAIAATSASRKGVTARTSSSAAATGPATAVANGTTPTAGASDPTGPAANGTGRGVANSPAANGTGPSAPNGTAATRPGAAAGPAPNGAAIPNPPGSGAANGTTTNGTGPDTCPGLSPLSTPGSSAQTGMPPASTSGIEVPNGTTTDGTGPDTHSGLSPLSTPGSGAQAGMPPAPTASSSARAGMSPVPTADAGARAGVTPASARGPAARARLSSASAPGSGGRSGASASAPGSGGRLSGAAGFSAGAAAVSVRPDYTGLWAYTVAIFMIGPIVLGRYDIMVTMVATVALVAAGRSAAATWRMRGAAIGLGAALKLWPVAIAIGLPKRANGRRALVWAALAALVPAFALAAVLPGSMGFLTGQHDRGLEIESVPATLFLIARHFGYPAKIRHQYGAFEITGPGIPLVATLSLVLTLAGFVWLLAVWRRRANLVPGRWTTALYYDAGLVAVLIAIVTSRVLSPQYLVWLVGLIALCLTMAPHASDGVVLESGAVSSAGTVLEPGTVVGSSVLLGPAASPPAPAEGEGRSVLAGPCWTLLAAISVTQVDFPLLFPRLIHDGRWAAWFLGSRNLLLLAAAVWGIVALWRAVAPAPRPATRGEPAAVTAEPCSRVAQPEQQPAGQ